jgi:hypothetical protein
MEPVAIAHPLIPYLLAVSPTYQKDLNPEKIKIF